MSISIPIILSETAISPTLLGFTFIRLEDVDGSPLSPTPTKITISSVVAASFSPISISVFPRHPATSSQSLASVPMTNHHRLVGLAGFGCLDEMNDRVIFNPFINEIAS